MRPNLCTYSMAFCSINSAIVYCVHIENSKNEKVHINEKLSVKCWTLYALNCRSFNYEMEGKGYQTQIMNDKITVYN